MLWFCAVEPMTLVLLGCRVRGPAALSPTSARRAERALRAYRDGEANHILACGGKSWDTVREADALCAYLSARGVPHAVLEKELRSRSTRQNARFAARLLLPRGVRRVLLVTCDFHMERALACFRGAGFDPVPMPSLSPTLSVKDQWQRKIRERVSGLVDRLLTRGFSRV